MKQIALFIFFSSGVIFLHGCSAQIESTRKLSLKQQTISDLSPILTDAQVDELKGTWDDDAVNEFVNKFWAKTDPTPGTPVNEYKDEYEKRVKYANEHFPDLKGWGKSDMKRIYLQYGPPDDIERHDWSDRQLSWGKRMKSYEIWVYFEPAKNSYYPTKIDENLPGIKKFLFVDYYGARVFKLIHSSEDIQDIDAILDKSAGDYN